MREAVAPATTALQQCSCSVNVFSNFRVCRGWFFSVACLLFRWRVARVAVVFFRELVTGLGEGDGILELFVPPPTYIGTKSSAEVPGGSRFQPSDYVHARTHACMQCVGCSISTSSRRGELSLFFVGLGFVFG